jgi:methylmalonyl-CoA mutase N-terminal domain/subunit
VKIPTQRVDETVAARQRERLAALRARRDAARTERLRGALRATAAGSDNLMPAIVAAVEGDVTLGEICADLRTSFGTYTPADRG